ncbi:hypothetical protein [Nocardia sp. NPDC057227]|uniref:hypothetical protein n=1 Tax=Nocardia sp. NPDC057227 TaxID=3346056 RepID=UPI0036451C2A
MSEFTRTDGLSRLVIEREPGGRIRIAVHALDAEDGYAVSFDGDAAREIADFVRPVQLFPTDPVQYRRDQYDPRDSEESR